MAGTLELQITDDAVFAHYMPPNAGPNIGGYLGKVYPSGNFHGVGFDELRALGTGRHRFVMDERAHSVRGREPEYESEWRRLFEKFRFSLFTYSVGLSSPLEVLKDASEVILLEPESKQAEPDAPPDCGGE